MGRYDGEDYEQSHYDRLNLERVSAENGRLRRAIEAHRSARTMPQCGNSYLTCDQRLWAVLDPPKPPCPTCGITGGVFPLTRCSDPYHPWNKGDGS